MIVKFESYCLSQEFCRTGSQRLYSIIFQRDDWYTLTMSETPKIEPDALGFDEGYIEALHSGDPDALLRYDIGVLTKEGYHPDEAEQIALG